MYRLDFIFKIFDIFSLLRFDIFVLPTSLLDFFVDTSPNRVIFDYVERYSSLISKFFYFNFSPHFGVQFDHIYKLLKEVGGVRPPSPPRYDTTVPEEPFCACGSIRLSLFLYYEILTRTCLSGCSFYFFSPF